MSPLLATCNYSAFVPAMGIAVRTSVGHPRFWRGPKLETLPSTYPGDLRHLEDRKQFEVLYRLNLDAATDRVASELEALSAGYSGLTLVLLCYEDLSKGKWCHRTVLAEWLQSRMEIAIPELGPQPRPSMFAGQPIAVPCDLDQ